MKGVVVLFLSLLSCCLVASANVVLIGNNVTMAFNDIEANFGEFFFNIFFMFVLVFSC
jgi:E3 ubiquitin-protein ligase RNF13